MDNCYWYNMGIRGEGYRLPIKNRPEYYHQIGYVKKISTGEWEWVIIPHKDVKGWERKIQRDGICPTKKKAKARVLEGWNQD